MGQYIFNCLGFKDHSLLIQISHILRFSDEYLNVTS